MLECCLPAFAAAQAWPDKPVKVVVPFGPGGSSDLMARLLQKTIEDEKLLTQPMAIVNVNDRANPVVQRTQCSDYQGTRSGHEFCVNNYWFAPKGTPKAAIDGMANALEKSRAKACAADSIAVCR